MNTVNKGNISNYCILPLLYICGSDLFNCDSCGLSFFPLASKKNKKKIKKQSLTKNNSITYWCFFLSLFCSDNFEITSGNV